MKPNQIVDVTCVPDVGALYALSGKSVIVTGAGAGIGKRIAGYMAAAGARVIAADINAENAQRTATELQAALGDEGKIIGLGADVSSEKSVSAMFDATEENFGVVDVLVNNAGVTMKCSFPEVTLDQWDRLHAVNLRGVFICMREAIRRMQGRGGSIVNISSVSSMHVGAFGNSTYAAAKAGVNALTQSVALEYAPQGIRINAVMPGRIDVARNVNAGSTMKIGGPFTESHRIPLGRPGTPDDIGAAVLFLASPAASYITGQLLAVDGGFLLS
jgi:NAD(P)-dependent dehydrogenase (short-subunit alcohol dehydrogenase family)